MDHGGSSAAIRGDVGASDGVDGRVAAAEEGVSAQGERPLAAEAGQGRAGEGGAQASRCGAAAVESGPEGIVHDLRNEVCLDCGGALEDTGEFDEHTVEGIPPPRVDVHRYRRHRQRCTRCAKVSQSAAPPEVTDAYVGPRTRLLPGASGDLAGQVHHALGRGVRAEAESRRSAGAHSVGQCYDAIRWSSGCLSCSSRNP